MRLRDDLNGDAMLHVEIEKAEASCGYRMLVHALSRKFELYIESLHWVFLLLL